MASAKMMTDRNLALEVDPWVHDNEVRGYGGYLACPVNRCIGAERLQMPLDVHGPTSVDICTEDLKSFSPTDFFIITAPSPMTGGSAC